jgi:hypothetical protein
MTALPVSRLTLPHLPAATAEVRWAEESASPWATVRARVKRGALPADTKAELRVILDCGDGEQTLLKAPLILDEEHITIPYALEYPFDELRDVTLCYSLELEPEGMDAIRSRPLVVNVLRYRFGS